jgi:hypothetical protein
MVRPAQQAQVSAGKHDRARAEPRAGPDKLINLKKTAEFDRLIDICSANIRARPGDNRPLMIRASAYMKKGTSHRLAELHDA